MRGFTSKVLNGVLATVIGGLILHYILTRWDVSEAGVDGNQQHQSPRPDEQAKVIAERDEELARRQANTKLIVVYGNNNRLKITDSENAMRIQNVFVIRDHDLEKSVFVPPSMEIRLSLHGDNNTIETQSFRVTVTTNGDENVIVSTQPNHVEIFGDHGHNNRVRKAD